MELGVAERRTRERAQREQRITVAARTIAEDAGWEAVTIRRLADAIEYSQPVVYSHFANRAAIVMAVAVEGFRELAHELREARRTSPGPQHAHGQVAQAYLAFARAHPRVYEAMFTLPTDLAFAEADTRPELRDAFAALGAGVAPLEGEGDLITETFWATLHGLAELERSARIRYSAHDERVALVAEMFGRV